jgi:hypothetical protein
MKMSKSRSSKFLSFVHVSGKICVICAILDGKDVITIAPTGSRKSLTYWMSLLFIKYGITSGCYTSEGQFSKMLQDNGVSVVSITAANATNELFEASLLILFTHSVDSIC